MYRPGASVSHAFRRLARTPGFTFFAVTTLALGIGANTALFSVVNGVLLRSLPFTDSHELVFMHRPGDSEGDISVPDAEDLRAEATSFREIAAFLPYWAYDLTGDGDPERVVGSVVEPDYFRALGSQPLLGRVITQEDNVAGGQHVAVLGHGFWLRRFGGDPETVGRTITLSGQPYTILGVMPPEFDVFQAGTDVWTPVAVETPWALNERGTNNFEVIGRLAAGVSLDAAASEIGALSERLANAYPDTNQAKILTAVRLRDFVVRHARPILLLLFGAVGLVLLITCVNLANLFAVRTTGREDELAVRLALGGGRLRIVVAMLSESLIVSIAGAALGILFAVWGTQVLISLGPDGLPRASGIALDRAVLGFTLGLSLATGVFFGLLPALRAIGKDPAELFGRTSSRGSVGVRRQRFLSGFVIAEVALASLLLVGSGLLVRSFLELRSVELGFEPEGVLAASLVLPESRYADPALQTETLRRIVTALDQQPSVERGGFVIGAPLSGFGQIGFSIAFDDRPEPEPGQRPGARVRPILGDYFGTMDVPLVRGRPFDDRDDNAAEPVAIVNQAFVDRYWPDENAVGKRVASMYGDDKHWMTVVGVVGDVKNASLALPDATTIYIPYAQRQMEWARFGTLVARGPGRAEASRGAVESAVWSVDPSLAFDAITSMEASVSTALAPQRFTSMLVALFAAIALLIAVQGIYGVLSFAVLERYGEIGIRMALGARPGDVLGLVMRQGFRLSLIGLGLGLGAALGLSRLIQSVLFEVSPGDALTYVVVAVVLAGTAILASSLPARRATRVDPIRALRYD